jgi:hypothetical protein
MQRQSQMKFIVLCHFRSISPSMKQSFDTETLKKK